MNKQDEFGDRMKAYEHEYTDVCVPRDQIMCVRIDGKRFSKFTKGCVKPFDSQFTDAMIETTKRIINQTHAKVGYTQSDEITLIYTVDNDAASHIFNGKVSKVNSILASMATAYFNDVFEVQHNGMAKLAMFDCRTWAVPSYDEASNVLMWRVQDCRKNSVSAAYRWIGNQKTTLKQPEMKKVLREEYGYDWDNETDTWKYGTFVKRVREERDDGLIRSKIVALDMGYFGELSFDERVAFVRD